MSGEVRDGSGSGSVAQCCVGTVRDGSEGLGIGQDRVGGGWNVSVYNMLRRGVGDFAGVRVGRE